MFALIFLTNTASFVFAQSSYVLPYPSAMPGSKFYKLHQLFEGMEKYWYFGDFASYHYNLKYSDKYLVESKTLFEYGQYLLAYEALKKSDFFFNETKESLEKANRNKKNIDEKKGNLRNASLKHIEVLNQLISLTPQEFDWKPEKGNPSKIKIKEKINESIKVRAL